ARAAALRGALLPVSVVAPAGGEAGAGRPYPRSCLRPHGHAGATPARGGDGARPDAGDHPALAHRRVARGAAQPVPAPHPQGVAAGPSVHRGDRVAEGPARDVAGGRPAHSRRAVRRGPRLLLRVPGGADARAGGLAHPRGRIRGAPRGQHGRAEERAPGDPDRGAVAVVEGRDAAAYVQELEALSEDPARQDLLIARGRARAREFTWQRTAERTAEVYRQLL